MTGPDTRVPPMTDSEPEQKQSSFARLFGVLFSPQETMEDIARRPTWVVPLVVVVIVTTGLAFLAMPHIDFEDQFVEQWEKQGMSEEQIENALAMTQKFQKFQSAFVIVLYPVGLLIVAGLLLLMAKLFGGEGTFKQAFSITNYGMMPQLIKGILSTAILMTKGTIDARQAATIVKSNLGFLASPVDAPVAFAFLSSIDVFTFWTLALWAIGMAYSSRLSRGVVTALVVGLWLVWVLIKMGFAALGAMGG